MKAKTVSTLLLMAGLLQLAAGQITDAEGKLKTNGGRVMAITSFGETIEEARQKSLDTASLIQYSGKNYRHDIGMDLIKLDN